MCICGISSRFQLLSPCAGQVIHALLTRPPLSHLRLPPEGFRRRCFVRLACVRHAASVHPEPGSNSHLNVCFLTGSRLAFALLFPVRFTFSWVHLSLTKDDSFSEISIEFSGLFHCLVVKVHLLQTIHITLGLLFHHHFSSMRQQMISYHIFFCLSTLFSKDFDIFCFALKKGNKKSCKNNLQLFNGERGIRTLAPLLTTYSLSRGAPSASLGISPWQN